jgi:hypothetical protein
MSGFFWAENAPKTVFSLQLNRFTNIRNKKSWKKLCVEIPPAEM